MKKAEGYPKLHCQLSSGDLLLLYTDGVTEATATQNSMFGVDRLRKSLAQTPFPAQLNQWTESLRKDIQAFTGTQHQEDDITLALLKVN